MNIPSREAGAVTTIGATNYCKNIPMRMRLDFFLALVISSAVAAKPPRDGMYSCEFRQPQTCLIGDAEIQVAGGRVQKVSYWHHTCIVHGRLGYGCTFDVERNYLEHDPYNFEQKWTDQGSSTTVTVTNKHDLEETPSTVALHILKSGVVFDFKDSGPGWYYCGFATSLPGRVFVPFRSRHCKVAFRKE